MYGYSYISWDSWDMLSTVKSQDWTGFFSHPHHTFPAGQQSPCVQGSGWWKSRELVGVPSGLEAPCGREETAWSHTSSEC